MVVVGDIDRGGVFAAMYGTLALLDAADQALVAGFVVNKFRGDEPLLRPGLDKLQRADRPADATACCRGARTCGSTPRTRSTSAGRRAGAAGDRRAAGRGGAAAAHLATSPTSTPSACEPGVDVRVRDRPARRSPTPTSSCCPGTRATLADLAWLRERGLDRAVVDHAARGGARCSGICGGFQMLGATHRRPGRRRGRRRVRRPRGWACSTCRTTFGAEKVLRLPTGGGAAAPASRLRDPPRPGHRRRGRGVPRAAPARRGLRHDVARQPGARRPAPGLLRRGRRPARRAVRRRPASRFAAVREARLDAARRRGGGAPRPRRAARPRRVGAHPRARRSCAAGSLEGPVRNYFLPFSVRCRSVDSAAMKASWGTSTRPTIFIRFLPSFCFSSSLRLRVMSPP